VDAEVRKYGGFRDRSPWFFQVGARLTDALRVKALPNDDVWIAIDAGQGFENREGRRGQKDRLFAGL